MASILAFFYSWNLAVFKMGDNRLLNWIEQILSGGGNFGEEKDVLHCLLTTKVV